MRLAISILVFSALSFAELSTGPSGSRAFSQSKKLKFFRNLANTPGRLPIPKAAKTRVGQPDVVEPEREFIEPKWVAVPGLKRAEEDSQANRKISSTESGGFNFTPTLDNGGAAVTPTVKKGGTSFVFRDDGSKDGEMQQAETAPKLQPISRNREPQSKTGGGSQNESNPVVHPWKRPVCFLIDEANVANAGTIVKDVADSYAKCKVALVPEVFIIKETYPADPVGLDESGYKKVLKNSQSSCPIGDHYGVGGKSSVQTHVNRVKMADAMCGSKEIKNRKEQYTENVSGCAELGPAPFKLSKEGQEKWDNMEDKYEPKNADEAHFGGKAGDGKPGGSIVDKNQSSGVAVHELQHNLGGVNTEEGDPRKNHNRKIESQGKDDDTFTRPQSPMDFGTAFTREGCVHVRGGATDNDIEYPHDMSDDVASYFNHKGKYKTWDIMAGINFLENKDPGDGKITPKPIPDRRNRDLTPGKPVDENPRVTQVPIIAGKHKKKAATAAPTASQDADFFSKPDRSDGAVATSEEFTDEKSITFEDDFFEKSSGEDTSIVYSDDGSKDRGANRLLGSVGSRNSKSSPTNKAKSESPDSEDSEIGSDSNFFDNGNRGPASEGIAETTFSGGEETGLDEEFFNKPGRDRADEDPGEYPFKKFRSYNGNSI